MAFFGPPIDSEIPSQPPPHQQFEMCAPAPAPYYGIFLIVNLNYVNLKCTFSPVFCLIIGGDPRNPVYGLFYFLPNLTKPKMQI